MGTYLNPGNGLFQIALNSQIFVDKSNLNYYFGMLWISIPFFNNYKY